jgi:dihydrofolate synthase/folylpolyglutamate synthase
MFKKLPMYQNIGDFAYKKDLSNIILICEHLNNPQNNFKSIHVGGTNGKGSCSHMLSSILQEAGYKVGLYTSPHLVDFRERVRINGEMISKDSVSEFMLHNFDFFESNNVSFFEMTVGLAFNYFSFNKVDIAIIEVGMGGRLDSTNIIAPILSLITNISIDHTKFLGSNISDIAREKAGIIKEKTPIVIGETQDEIKSIFIDIANTKGSEIVFADDFIYDNYDCDLQGIYQKKNIKTVLKGSEILQQHDYKINDGHIKAGLNNVSNNTGFKGRWQVIQNNPLIICDTAHNIAALKEVISQLIRLEYSKLYFIIGFSDDKDLDKISKIFPENSEYYFVKPKVDRGKDSQEVKQIFESNNRIGITQNSVNEAINQIKKTSSKDDVIFIGGSTFVVSEIFQ